MHRIDGIARRAQCHTPKVRHERLRGSSRENASKSAACTVQRERQACSNSLDCPIGIHVSHHSRRLDEVAHHCGIIPRSRVLEVYPTESDQVHGRRPVTRAAGWTLADSVVVALRTTIPIPNGEGLRDEETGQRERRRVAGDGAVGADAPWNFVSPFREQVRHGAIRACDDRSQRVVEGHAKERSRLASIRQIDASSTKCDAAFAASQRTKLALPNRRVFVESLLNLSSKTVTDSGWKANLLVSRRDEPRITRAASATIPQVTATFA